MNLQSKVKRHGIEAASHGGYVGGGGRCGERGAGGTTMPDGVSAVLAPTGSLVEVGAETRGTCWRGGRGG